MGHNGGGPPDKTSTLDRTAFMNTADWDQAVSDLYKAKYEYYFHVDSWVTFGPVGGYK